MENSTHIFREGPYVSTHVRIGNQKKFCHELELVKEKRGNFLHHWFCSKEIFLTLGVLSQCTVYWIDFQNINTLHTLLIISK